MRPYRFPVLVVIFFLFFKPAFTHTAQDTLNSAKEKKKFPVSGFIAFSINTLIAEGREYVCNHGSILSDLRWPLIPSVSYTVSGGVYFPKGIHLDGTVSFLQPMHTGTMIDRDFQGIGQSPLMSGVTEFSEHKCSIIDGIRGTAKLGLQLPMPQTAAMQKTGIAVLVEPMISVHCSTISWYSYDGYLQYANKKKDGSYEPWSRNLPKIPIFGPVISYRQQLVIPAIGVGFEASFPHNLSVSSDFHVNSGIVAVGEDIHYTRNERFVDIIGNGWAVHGTARLSWQCLPYFSVFFSLFYEYSISLEGRTVHFSGINARKPNGISQFNAAGTSLYGCTFSSGIAFVLGR